VLLDRSPGPHRPIGSIGSLLFRRFTDINVYTLHGTECVKIRKTRHKISVDIRIFSTVQTSAGGVQHAFVYTQDLARLHADEAKVMRRAYAERERERERRSVAAASER